MKKLWFKRKSYGWGWTPCTWEGWVSIGLYIGLLCLNFSRYDQNLYSKDNMPMSYIVETILLTAILIIVCYVKGETPKWQWGKKKDDTDQKKK